MSREQEPERIRIDIGILNGIADKVADQLDDFELKYLRFSIQTLAWLTGALAKTKVSVKRLKAILFGPKSEKTKAVVNRKGGKPDGDSGPQDETAQAPGETQAADEEEKARGHGRNGAADYPGAKQVHICSDTLKPGDICPECGKGKVYRMESPKVLVNVTGQPPLGAVVYFSERLRCNLCQTIFAEAFPPEAREEKYDEASASTIALLKYGSGTPFYRIEQLQAAYGIPMPASTQWDIVKAAASSLEPVHEELVRQAAQGTVLYNDDTKMRILSLMGPIKGLEVETTRPDGRTGIFTTGILSEIGTQTISLFFTGWRHAGENLAQVLAKREKDLEDAIQMCDALSRNTTSEFKTILANCIAHARREFVPLVTNFPNEVRHVLEQIGKIYKTDATAKNKQLTAKERLILHEKESGPVMAELKKWLDAQIEQKLIEPNGTLGDAIRYMQKHWEKLTLFLKKEGAPLDNNLCEMAIKRVILHRKNAYFYRTENGARVGDLYMSLINTAKLAHVSPFHYLTELQQRSTEVAKDPKRWMPWNYLDTIEAEDAAAREVSSATG
jgi:transposase